MGTRETRQSSKIDMQEQIEALQQQLASLQASIPSSSLPNVNASITMYSKLPAIQLITPKLDGKRTYRAWSTNIEAIALSIEDIWNVIYEDTPTPASQRQYARSLLLLNMIPSLQTEVQGMASAYEIWTYLKGQFGKTEFADVAILVRRIVNIRWSRDTDIEKFYHEFKDAQMTIKEVTGRPLQDEVLISIFLLTVEDSYSDFVSHVEAHLSHPTALSIQKTFEYTFGRFRTEVYRQRARDANRGYDAVGRVEDPSHSCGTCKRKHPGKSCWTEHPEHAPAHLREHYQKRHDEWKGPAKEVEEGPMRICG